MKSVSILDIAKKTGMSRNTVAKALRFDPSVSHDTCMRIIHTAYDMNYSKLSEEALRVIGIDTKKEDRKFLVLISKDNSEFWNKIVVGISDELRRHDAYCQLAFIGEEDEKNLIVPGITAADSFEGIICLFVFSDEYTAKIASYGKPIIFLDCPIGNRPYSLGDTFVFDGLESVFELTTELISNGRKKIGFIGNTHYCESMYERYSGYVKAMEAAGLEIDERFLITDKNKNLYYTQSVISEWLDNMKELPEAFVCVNDEIAMKVYRYCQKRNIAIPKQLAITGFDNIKESKVVSPRLSTANIENYQLGKRLVQQLIWRLENSEMPVEFTYVSAKVVIRASSGK